MCLSLAPSSWDRGDQDEEPTLQKRKVRCQKRVRVLTVYMELLPGSWSSCQENGAGQGEGEIRGCKLMVLAKEPAHKVSWIVSSPHTPFNLKMKF